ncbi:MULTISPECIES: DNA-directed RNA polymerase subunit H [Halomicrobium]|uniref:DNA-directed RNA polymerase subunit Rpo5 n=2 Tax=Halomicrobium mukohataei TaxID=57705 RepID=C7NYI9_HALMD|nr:MULTISPECIES: DNA-directed RNA polymerase subunit H [Halomicrobium]ACV46650.1 RNA polymerase Rpb5 [Halomicrobium mukohataei DSM 12286]MBO4247459.1 DNA-directed RNA polymerase subunit H [Halomicrobium sp. IBSBa]QCD65160.1 DNA-directed RNA polymerase subunit H [Halomicrobium mukohataei]QFR19966.1 DNA-directed RNA polymerase subunit H [Halomicrobium sp. ZPS1]
MVDVSQHELVPDHSIVDEDVLDDVLEEYNIKKTDLPKIKRTDPATPDEAEVGDVIKIVRNSRTTDQAVVYRLVVS